MVWKLIRQDAHGSRFDVASVESEEEALDAMASYESGYPHHQTYCVEHRTGVRPGDPLAFDYPIESLQDVLVVLTHLRTNLESDPDSWENSTLPGFLEAMAAWLSTFPQVYVNLDEPVPEADWKLLADCTNLRVATRAASPTYRSSATASISSATSGFAYHPFRGTNVLRITQRGYAFLTDRKSQLSRRPLSARRAVGSR